MPDNIKKLEHIFKQTLQFGFVDWRLGNTCNYACSYCPDYEHSGDKPWLDIADYITAQNNIIDGYRQQGKLANFAYTGGEPTVFKDFNKLLENGKRQDAWQWVYSNGGRTVRYWDTAKDLLDQVVISYHADYDKTDHIIEVTDIIKKHVWLNINVVMHPLYMDRCFNFISKFRQAHPDIKLDTKIVRVNHGYTVDPRYTKEDFARMAEYKASYKQEQYQDIKKTYRGKRLSMELTEPNEKPRIINPQEEIIKGPVGYNDFDGWDCYIGVESLLIDFDGSVWRGYCKMGGQIGQIPNVSIPTEPVVCKWLPNRCDCNMDFTTTKYSKPMHQHYVAQVNANKTFKSNAKAAQPTGILKMKQIKL